MTKVLEVGTLEIRQDPEFQRKEWPVLRAGWLLIALLILAGAAGLLGAGPLSDAVTRSDDGRIVLTYDRVVRHYAEARLEVRINTDADTVAVWFSRDYLAGVEIRNILPEPLSTRTAGDRVWFDFAANGAATILIRMQPDNIGVRPLRLGLERGGEITIKQLVLP